MAYPDCRRLYDYKCIQGSMIYVLLLSLLCTATGLSFRSRRPCYLASGLVFCNNFAHYFAIFAGNDMGFDNEIHAFGFSDVSHTTSIFKVSVNQFCRRIRKNNHSMSADMHGLQRFFIVSDQLSFGEKGDKSFISFFNRFFSTECDQITWNTFI
jgi:hypothetical protein